MRHVQVLGTIIAVAVVTLTAHVAFADEATPDLSFRQEAVEDTDRVEISAEMTARTHSTGDSSFFYDVTGGFVEVPSGGRVQVQPVVAESWCDRLHRDVVSHHPCFGLRVADDPSDEQEADAEVDPQTVLYSALAVARVDGAGLVVQPDGGWVFRGVPTLAHASAPVVDVQVEVLGYVVPVRFEAMEFVFDFHSGEPPVRTTDPGRPYPDMSIQGVYWEEREAVSVSLSTLWSATVVHPVTGDSLRVDGVLRTVEESAPFRVVKSRHRLISEEEFGDPR